MLKALAGAGLAVSVVGIVLAARCSGTAHAAEVAGAPDRSAKLTGGPTFNKDVAPIVFDHCASCHRPGEVAPFPLLTYADVKKHAKEIDQVITSRQMPPWRPEHGYGDFIGERRLTDGQIDTLEGWLKSEKAEGNAADLPATPKFPQGWQLGEPDLVVKMPEAYTVKAEGRDEFRIFVLPLNLTEDKYVEAVEYRPGNRKIVHHALLYLDTSGRAKQLDDADPLPGYGHGGGLGFMPSGGLGGWAPGVTPRRLPDGIGRLVKKGSDLVLQTHFHPSGKVETEQSTVGLYFAKKTPQKLFISTMQIAGRLDIPAGEKNYETSRSFVVPTDVKLAGVFPHAHLLCKEVQVTATLPDGKELSIIWIKDWDWDWQDEYLYQHPIDIPQGTKVFMRFRYDNSADNPRNPTTPPRRVRWGEQTQDEMALVFFQILIDRQMADLITPRGRGLARGQGAAGGGDRRQFIFQKLMEAARRNGTAPTNDSKPKEAGEGK
ncbi:MAG TPA: hypothetical protein VG269_21770 [Tepidisphaeraceae bacterium]|jgi:mono/diheme cytochrome c family protein|nr:hypothetical protein [Tepidisphaeraceae bacterium]